MAKHHYPSTKKGKAPRPTSSIEVVSPAPEKPSSGASRTKPSNAKMEIHKAASGRKRDAEGNVKVADLENEANRKSNRDDEENRLLQEILALGGTDEDLELVLGVASDEEGSSKDTNAKTDKALRKELASFVSSLGIATDAAKDLSEGEADEGNKRDNAADSRSPSVSEESVKVKAPTKVAARQPASSNHAAKIQSSKDLSKLVSSTSRQRTHPTDLSVGHPSTP